MVQKVKKKKVTITKVENNIEAQEKTETVKIETSVPVLSPKKYIAIYDLSLTCKKGDVVSDKEVQLWKDMGIEIDKMVRLE